MKGINKKLLKINFVIPSTVLGGGVRMVFIYANYLVSQGHNVVVYVPQIFAWEDVNKGRINVKTSIANTFKRGLKVQWFDCNFKICFALKIKDSYIRDADITIATAWYTAKNVYNLSENKGEKVYFIQDYEVNNQETNKKLVEDSYKLPMHKIVIAKWLDNIVFNLSGEHAKVIYNGTADEEFFYGKKTINNPKAVIMLGNTATHKGWKQGLEILKKIKKDYNCRIILYGARTIENLPNNFEFYLLPSRNALMRLYTEADICLFPSIREGWGLTVTEAMAHQCAIVGNNTGAVKEICEDGVNALVSKDIDFLELKENLIKIIKDEDLLRRLQKAALETADNYRESRQCEIFCKTLEFFVDKNK